MGTDVLEEHITSIFRVENKPSKKPVRAGDIGSYMDYTALYPRRWQIS
jgi:hypothetical protein